MATTIPWPGLGGLERHLDVLSTGLADRGHQVILVARRPPGPAHEMHGGVAVHRLRGTPLPPEPVDAALGFQSGFLVRLAAFLVRARARYDVLYVAPISRYAEVAALVARATGKRVVGRVVVPSAAETRARPGAGRALHARLRRGFDAVVAQSAEIEQMLLDGGLPPGRVVAIPNPVDTRRFAPAAPDDRPALRRARWPQWPDDAVIVLTASRLVADKGTATLLRAVAAADPALPLRVVVAGDGPARADLERLAASLGLGARISFVGTVTDMAPLYRSSDVFALLSHYEAQSNALLEALATGLPVVVTGVGGMGDSGRAIGAPTVMPGDHGATGAALEALARDPERRAALGTAARRLAEGRYAVDIVIPRYVDVFRRKDPA